MRCFYYLVAADYLFLYVRPAQVNVPVLKAQVFFYIGVVFNSKRRCFAFGKDPQVPNFYFDISRRYFRIFRRALAYFTARGKHVLGPHGKCLVEDLPVGRVVKSKLYNARPVTQVYKNNPAEVTLALHPAAHRNVPAYVRVLKVTAVACPLHAFHCFRH